MDENDVAISQYSVAAELAPKDAELQFNLGEALQRAGRTDDAIGSYEDALKLDDKLTAARVNLAKALAEKGLMGEAKEMLKEAIQRAPNDAEAHYNLGVLLMRENDMAGAMSRVPAALAINPKHAMAHNNLGVAYDALGRAPEGAEAFKKAIAADPEVRRGALQPGARVLLARRAGRWRPGPSRRRSSWSRGARAARTRSWATLYLQQGKKDRAVEAFKKAIEASADDGKKTTEAYQGLARAYLALGKVDDAVATLKKVVDDFPKEASARAAYGDALKAKGDLDGAIAQYEQGVALSPTAETQLSLADAYARKHVGAKAQPILEAILKDEPGNRAAKLALADLYLSMGRYAEVEKLLTPKEGEQPETAALARLGIMHSRLGRPDKALEMLEQVVKRDPSQLDARAELGQLYLRGGDAEKSVRVLGDVLAIEPRHPLALLYTGQALFRLGKTKESEQSFRAAAQVDPNFAEPHNALGQLLEATKRLDEAKAEYAKALELQPNHDDAKTALQRLGGAAASAKPH